jgi:hypothetical protein
MENVPDDERKRQLLLAVGAGDETVRAWEAGDVDFYWEMLEEDARDGVRWDSPGEPRQTAGQVPGQPGTSA